MQQSPIFTVRLEDKSGLECMFNIRLTVSDNEAEARFARWNEEISSPSSFPSSFAGAVAIEIEKYIDQSDKDLLRLVQNFYQRVDELSALDREQRDAFAQLSDQTAHDDFFRVSQVHGADQVVTFILPSGLGLTYLLTPGTQ